MIGINEMKMNSLIRTLEVTALMLDFEATCHEESGDAKRRSYVPILRAQVAKARAEIDAAKAGA